MTLGLSPPLGIALDPEAIAAAAQVLRQTGRTRLPLLLGEATHDLYQAIATPNLPWVRAFDIAVPADIPSAALDANRPDDHSGLWHSFHRQGRDQFQYVFDRLPLPSSPSSARPLPPVVHGLMDLFNSSGFLSFARRLTGHDRIAFVDGQVTRYLPGHFLNRHSDDYPRAERLYAYVLNLSPDWRADWGGLLQFLDAEGEIAETFVPCFGTLNVFAVPQMHAVSPVSPLAGGPRYSVTGWWRAVPAGR